MTQIKPRLGQKRVTQADLASALGLSRIRVQQLVGEGRLTKPNADGYLLSQAITEYVAYKMASAAERSGSSKPDRLKEAKASEIERKMAIAERSLIPLSEAIGILDQVVGDFLVSLGALPAKITRNQRERERIEEVVAETRTRLADKFRKRGTALASGRNTDDADDEDDA